MNLIDFIKDAVNKYGSVGDNSFEYIGLNMEMGRLVNTKVYRRGERALNEVLAKMPYRAVFDMLSVFRSCAGVRLCDISESVYGGIKSFRAAFSIPQKISQDKADDIVYLFFENLDFEKTKSELKKNYSMICDTLHIDYSPLMQLGVEFDEDGKFLAVKYYLSIKQILDRRVTADECLMRLLEKWDFSREKNETVCKNGYYPIFIGANADEKYTEYKLYFISEYLSRRTDIQEKMHRLFMDMKWDCISISEINEILDMGLYVEGIALPQESGNMERIYLNFLPKNLSGKLSAENKKNEERLL